MRNCGDCKYRLFKFTVLNKDSNMEGYETVKNYPYNDFMGNLAVKCKSGNTDKLLKWYENYGHKRKLETSTKSMSCFEQSEMSEIIDKLEIPNINPKKRKI